MHNTITIDYISGLGAFLDEHDIKWHGDPERQKITIYFTSEKMLFYLAYKFGQTKSK